MLCDQCGQAEATLMRRGGFMWNPICEECAEWFAPNRIESLDPDAVIRDELNATLLEIGVD